MTTRRMRLPNIATSGKLADMGRASRARRQRRQQAATQKTLADRVVKSWPDERIKIVQRETGRKVSDMLAEVGEPWLYAAQNADQRRMLLGMAMMAWNLAVLPEAERWDGLDQEFAQKLGEPGKALLNEMIARKLDLFPQETRAVLDYEITGDGDQMRLDVVSSLSPHEVAQLKSSGQGLEPG